jgi:hypothetical protein
VSINAGTGLTGGGALSTDRTLSMNWNGTTNTGDMVTYNSGNPTPVSQFAWDGTFLQVTADIRPTTDNTYNLGEPGLCWAEVWAYTFNTCGIFEQNLAGTNKEENNNQITGTVMVWKDGKLIPCNKENDHMRMGVMVNGKDLPIVQGAEPVLVVGEVKEGDYLVTSNKIGHAKAITREEMIANNLQDVKFAIALENGTGESDTINAYINI